MRDCSENVEGSKMPDRFESFRGSLGPRRLIHEKTRTNTNEKIGDQFDQIRHVVSKLDNP